MNKMIIENSPSKMKSVSMAWIDYRKILDSVPHNQQLKALDTYKVSPLISKFVQGSMTSWYIRLLHSHGKWVSQSINSNIKRGSFQGNSICVM